MIKITEELKPIPESELPEEGPLHGPMERYQKEEKDWARVFGGEKTETNNPETTVTHERRNYFILRTKGFINEIDPEEQATIMGITLQRITPQMDFLVFDPKAESVRIEDQGRTQIIPYRTIPKKVYAKLDDYGSPETLSKLSGRLVETQYTVTIMLAEEY